MKKFNLMLIMISFILIPNTIKALEIEESESMLTEYSETTKYYKTITVLNNSEMLSRAGFNTSSFTTEITEEEFYSDDEEDGINGSSYVSSSTKKVTASIAKISNSNYYKYTATAEWKKMPSVRSYDSIGIGFYPSVILYGTPHFEQYYCTTGGTCNTQNSGWKLYSSTYGTAATYYLPSGELSTLKHTFYAYLQKRDSSVTIYEQEAGASYGQATQSVTYTEAKDFTMSTAGLNYKSAYNKYSVVSVSNIWNGTW